MRTYLRLVIGATLVCLGASAYAANLYQPESFSPLAADTRATHVGDLITILVVETSSASNTADTATGANTAIQANLSTTFSRSTGVQLGLGDSYAGRGHVQRSERLIAQLSVAVDSVLSNGDLLVSGEQQINLNGEKTRIKLSGRIRPHDITDGNTVLSNRLADAKIDYVGDGYLTDRSKPGLIPRILGWLGLW